jgi:trehalose 6-phosphate phosphatase
MRTWLAYPVEFTRPTSQQRYDAFVAVASHAVIGLDMDGTLSPIVADPALAHIHPDAPATLVELAGVVRAIAIITGRPARQALALGGLDEVGTEIANRGRELQVFGQYGNERWSSHDRRVVSPRPPAGLARFLAELPRTLREAGAQSAYVEEKGLAVAVHTRRMADPAPALALLTPAVATLALRHGLTTEPGRNVIEVRAPGVDKGTAVRLIANEVSAEGFLFAGDDLGDVEAFAAVEEMRDQGFATLLVCSASDEQSELLGRSDVVVHGPEGVIAFLRQLTRDALTARRPSRSP